MAVKAVQVVINGQTHTLTYNAKTKKYEATITAPSTSSYNLDIIIMLRLRLLMKLETV